MATLRFPHTFFRKRSGIQCLNSYWVKPSQTPIPTFQKTLKPTGIASRRITQNSSHSQCIRIFRYIVRRLLGDVDRLHKLYNRKPAENCRNLYLIQTRNLYTGTLRYSTKLSGKESAYTILIESPIQTAGKAYC